MTTLEQAKQMADGYKVVPISREILSDTVTPMEVLRILKGVSKHCYMLESVENQEVWGRYTFLGYDPKLEITCMNGEMCIRESGSEEGAKEPVAHPGAKIKEILKEYISPKVKDLPSFTGGLVGYFSYDYVKYSEPKLNLDADDQEGFKDVDLMLFDKVIAFDNLRQKIYIIANARTENLEQEYGVRALPVNCEKLTREDICQILSEVLFEFPISEIQFFVPKWVEMLPRDHKIKQDLIEHVRVILERLTKIRDALGSIDVSESEYIDSCKVDQIGMGQGCVNINISIPERYYYEMLSEMTGTKIAGQYELVATIQELAKLKEEYEGVRDAFTTVRMKGYGVVSPVRDEITLLEPELIKQGNKYGVKIHSKAPSIHLIRANIETEIAPIVGTEDQAKDLLTFIKQEAETEHGIWETNIFGKSVEELVMDGIRGKIAMIGDESQTKLQDTMQKIVNDSNGGLVCIII